MVLYIISFWARIAGLFDRVVKLLNRMNKIDPSESSLPPPSLMKALTAGFDAISNHAWLVVFTLLLDLVLWMGPRFRLYSLFRSILEQPAALSSLGNPELLQSFWETIQSFNILSLIRTYPVGIPSLMVSRNPLGSPLGDPNTIEISTAGAAIAIWFVLNLLGVMAGTFYFSLVAQVATTGKVFWRNLINQFPKTFLQIFLLTVSWVLLLLIIGFPFSCILSFILFSGIGLEQVVLFLAVFAGGFLIWLLMPLVFSPHGIIMKQQKVWSSVKTSFRVARMTLPTTSLLILTIVLISEGMSILWRIPPVSSWLSIVGILGHAFITTSLLASTFIYFRDADQWVVKVLEKARLSIV